MPLLTRATPLIGHFQIRNRARSAGRSRTPIPPRSTAPSRSRLVPAWRRCRLRARAKSPPTTSSPGSGRTRFSPTKY
ncbi:hypothetical protein I553_1751 [Mycobacterium xenopi 4042]|uniref:Uncharacterized protein n=1 Tax=Mycobacterium xenopi 4042 TaxID=1299334 RepID=X8DLG3_MYCXE|nr:hypothetical protein I553_1751 [Mycobacterium xenopi 4042]